MNSQQEAAIWLQIFTAALRSPYVAADAAAGSFQNEQALVDSCADIADRGCAKFRERIDRKSKPNAR